MSSNHDGGERSDDSHATADQASIPILKIDPLNVRTYQLTDFNFKIEVLSPLTVFCSPTDT